MCESVRACLTLSVTHTAEEEVEVWEVERWMMAFRQFKRSRNEMCRFSGKLGV